MIKRLLLVFVSMLTIVSVMPVLAQDNDIHINNDTEQMQILNAEPNNHEDNHSSLINDSVENNFEEDTLIQDIILPDTQIILNYLDYCESEIFSYSTQLYDSWNIVDNAIIDAKTNENIFVAETPIKCAYIGINEIFYVTNDTLFRYHILSGTTDFICIAENVLSISPVTNMAGALFVENSAAKEPDVNYFDLTIGNKLLTESERVSQLGLEWRNSISTYSNEDSSVNSTNSSNNGEYGIYQIGNASLPLSNYRAGIGAYPYNNGWYFNRTTSSDIDVASTEECSIHSDDDSQNVDCWEVEGGYQCLAFAYYVYEHIWGEYWTDGRGDSIDEEYDCNMSFSSMDEYELYEYFENNIPLGSHIRVTSGSAYHSIILLDYNETNITYYHANYNSDFCRVFKDTLSWNEFKYRFPTCWYFVYPNANQIMTCSHTFGTPSSYTSEGHTVVCTECGAIATQNHTLQMSSTSNGHTEYCLYCNYFGSEVAHTPGWVTSSTGHTQKCTVTGCAYTITAEAAHSLSLYSRDDTYHDQKCSVCSYDTGVSGVHSKTYSLQSGTSNHIISCSSCDYSKTEAHSNITYTYTSATHSQKCGVCDYSISTANHGYSYTSNGTGSHQKYCGTCGYVASTNAAHTFSYGSWTYPGNLASTCKTRTGTCSYCKQTVSESSAHPSYTYTSNGSANHTMHCSNSSCSYSTSQSHSLIYGSWSDVSTSGTCERRYIHCSKCTYGYYEYDYSHSNSYGSWTDICTYDQCEKRYVSCNDCGYGYYEYDYTHDYTYTAWTSTTVGGYTQKRTGTCGDCGFKYTFYR